MPSRQLTHKIISSFVISYIRGTVLDIHDPIPSGALVDACLQELSDNYWEAQTQEATQQGEVERREVYADDREKIVEAIKRMKIEGMLRMFKLPGGRGRGFCLGEETQEEEDSMPEIILGDPASSDPSNRGVEHYGGEDVDESYIPTQEDEEDVEEEEDTPRAARMADSGNESTREEAEEVEEDAPVERTVWSEVPSLHLDRSSQQESIERAEAIRRHTDAYANMTANAAPLNPPSEQQQPPAQTPSRKRFRALEIADSEDSSSLDAISPQRYANSTPRRSLKRMRGNTPASASRRTSAPGRLFASPRRAGNLAGFPPLKLSQSNGEGSRMFNVGAEESVRFKEEKRRDTSDASVHEIVRDLRDKFPESSFEADNGRIKCLDCDKSFKATFRGLQTHCMGNAHQVIVREKASKTTFNSTMYKDTMFFPTTTKDVGIDFSIPQQPIAVLAYKSSQNVAALRAQLASAEEAENQTASMRMYHLESRQIAVEKSNAANLEKVKASIEASDERVKSLSDEVTEKLQASEEWMTGEISEVKDRLDVCEGKNDDQLKDMEDRISKNEENCDTKLDKLFTKLARSEQRNIENTEDLKADMKKAGKAAEEQFQQLQVKITDLESMNTSSQRDDIETSIRELEASDLETRNARAKMEGRMNEIDEGLRKSKEHREVLEAEMRALHNSHEKSQNLTSQLQTRLEELEKGNRAKEEEIHDLEANVQMCTEDVQRQRESTLSYQKTIKDQVAEHFEHTSKLISTAEKLALKKQEEALENQRAMQEQMERIEKLFMTKIEKMENAQAEEREKSTKKIQRLEKNIKELQDEMDQMSEKVVPLIFEDVQGARVACEAVKDRVEVLEGLAGGMGVTLPSRERGGSVGREIAV